jgi:hypothetical protein
MHLWRVLHRAAMYAPGRLYTWQQRRLHLTIAPTENFMRAERCAPRGRRCFARASTWVIECCVHDLLYYVQGIQQHAQKRKPSKNSLSISTVSLRL